MTDRRLTSVQRVAWSLDIREALIATWSRNMDNNQGKGTIRARAGEGERREEEARTE